MTIAIELEPDSPDAWTARGDLYQQMNLYEQALTDYHRAVELDPADATAVSGRGFIYQLMDRYEEALADSNRAIELDPNDAWVTATRGFTYHLMGLYQAGDRRPESRHRTRPQPCTGGIQPR